MKKPKTFHNWFELVALAALLGVGLLLAAILTPALS